MPLLDLEVQRRAVEVGRIRLGTSTPRPGGGKKPQTLEKWRFTSRSEDAVRAIAALWGGQPRPWEGSRGQWEVFSDVSEIPVVVPGGPAVISQQWELWDGGAVQRRCDGRYDTVSEGPCVCAQQNRRACKPISRVGLILADVPGMGTWRLETGGMNAALELGGSAELLAKLREAGQMVPATLRLETRQSGRNVYPVPVLVANTTFRALATGEMVGRPIAELLPPAPVPVAAISAGPRTGTTSTAPAVTPVAEIATDDDMAEQIQHAADADRLRELWNEVIRLHWQDVTAGQPFLRLIDHLNSRARALGLPTKDDV